MRENFLFFFFFSLLPSSLFSISEVIKTVFVFVLIEGREKVFFLFLRSLLETLSESCSGRIRGRASPENASRYFRPTLLQLDIGLWIIFHAPSSKKRVQKGHKKEAK